MGTHGPGRDLRGNKQPLIQTMYGPICGSMCLMLQKAKQRWAIEKAKLDNARQLRGIFFIEPNDEEFKLTMKAARRKLEIAMPPAMPCETPVNCRGETCRSIGKSKTKYACFVDAYETMSIRLEGVPHNRNKFTEPLQFGTQVHSDASSIENSRCEGTSGKRIGKIVENTAMAAAENSTNEQ